MTDEPSPMDRVKLSFLLSQDSDWPPVGEESVWARRVHGDIYRIDNTPFFARNVASGDLVEASEDDRNRLLVRRRIEPSGNCTIRLLVFPEGPLAGDRARVLGLFSPLGVHGEGIEAFSMVALTIPPKAAYGDVKKLIKEGFEQGWWDCEEGCVNNRWEMQYPPIR
jgi:hypothetical protein